MANTFIKISYTREEWIKLESICLDKFDKTLRTYLHTQMPIMAQNCQLIAQKEPKPKLPVNFIIPADICAELMRFARHRNISLSKLICWYNIDPLLKEHYDLKFKTRA